MCVGLTERSVADSNASIITDALSHHYTSIGSLPVGRTFSVRCDYGCTDLPARCAVRDLEMAGNERLFHFALWVLERITMCLRTAFGSGAKEKEELYCGALPQLEAVPEVVEHIDAQ